MDEINVYILIFFPGWNSVNMDEIIDFIQLNCSVHGWKYVHGWNWWHGKLNHRDENEHT
jgi:hypothetical protein